MSRVQVETQFLSTIGGLFMAINCVGLVLCGCSGGSPRPGDASPQDASGSSVEDAADEVDGTDVCTQQCDRLVECGVPDAENCRADCSSRGNQAVACTNWAILGPMLESCLELDCQEMFECFNALPECEGVSGCPNLEVEPPLACEEAPTLTLSDECLDHEIIRSGSPSVSCLDREGIPFRIRATQPFIIRTMAESGCLHGLPQEAPGDCCCPQAQSSCVESMISARELVLEVDPGASAETLILASFPLGDSERLVLELCVL